MKKKKRAGKRSALLLLLLVAVPLYIAADYYMTFRADNVGKSNIILIEEGESYDTLIHRILSCGAIIHEKSFLKAAKKREFSGHFESGRYLLEPGMSNQSIIRTICNKWETPVNLTFRGYIKTTERIAGFLGKEFEADSAEFAEVLLDKNFRDSLGFTRESMIGLFIPDTYQIYWSDRPKNIILRFKKEYDKFWEGERDRLAHSIGLTRNEVMTLASIVAEETNNTSEMPKIAGVYMNRLKKKMPLQACPTIKYAHLESEPNLTRILYKHLKIESDYNTYKNRGLPPGPITVPPVSAIEAVLHYERSGYLYFCAKPQFDGTHNFATTLSEHNKNSKAYSKAFEEKFGS